jgi:hypothetical protein
MSKYKVTLSDGSSFFVEANSEAQAKRIAYLMHVADTDNIDDLAVRSVEKISAFTDSKKS